MSLYFFNGHQLTYEAVSIYGLAPNFLQSRVLIKIESKPILNGFLNKKLLTLLPLSIPKLHSLIVPSPWQVRGALLHDA